MTTDDLPIRGMTVRPALLSVDGGAAFISCVYWAASEGQCRDQFRKDTGLDIAVLLQRSPLDKMIDEATGYEGEVVARFADWVAQTIWGTDQ